MNKQPIGILDSGVGGLTIWKEISKLLPHESTIYIGDSLNAPYGKKNSFEIVSLAKILVRFLIQHEVKLIVIACNTITLNGIDLIRASFPKIPIIGTVPVVKGAANTSQSKRIGLLATTAGAQSAYVQNLIKEFASECSVTTVATDEIVPLVEVGGSNSHKMKEVLEHELKPLQRAGIDTLVLGSTHFPYVKDQIQQILGQTITILDSGPAIARQVGRVLKAEQLEGSHTDPHHTVYTTGDATHFQTILEQVGYNRARILIERVHL